MTAIGPAGRADRVALWWTDSSIVWLLAAFVMLLLHSTGSAQPADLGLARIAALVVTPALAAIGVVGEVLFRRGVRGAAAVLGAYSILWIAGLAAVFWWAASSTGALCLAGIGICITTGQMTAGTVVVLLPFVLVIVWAWRRLA